MKWARPNKKGVLTEQEPVAGESRSESAFSDFNSPMPEWEHFRGTDTESVTIPECIEDIRDVEEVERRLADSGDKTISLDDLRNELGL
jgi:hypothetical protein